MKLNELIAAARAAAVLVKEYPKVVQFASEAWKRSYDNEVYIDSNYKNVHNLHVEVVDLKQKNHALNERLKAVEQEQRKWN